MAPTIGCPPVIAGFATPTARSLHRTRTMRLPGNAPGLGRSLANGARRVRPVAGRFARSAKQAVTDTARNVDWSELLSTVLTAGHRVRFEMHCAGHHVAFLPDGRRFAIMNEGSRWSVYRTPRWQPQGPRIATFANLAAAKSWIRTCWSADACTASSFESHSTGSPSA